MSRRDGRNNCEPNIAITSFLTNKREREFQKHEKIEKIKYNFHKLEQLFKREEIKQLFENLNTFTAEEISKFLQNLANHEFLSLSSHQSKSKNPITLNIPKIHFDPYEISDSFQKEKVDSQLSRIHDLILTNTKEKTLVQKTDESSSKNLNKTMNNINNKNPNNTISVNDYLESITQNMKVLLASQEVSNVKHLENIIKLYSNFIHSNNKSIDQEEKLISSLIKENTKSAPDHFFSLCSYWLYTEYLLSFESNDFYRYDSILVELISLIQSLEKIDDDPYIYNEFISNIPRYNARFINYIIAYHKKYFHENYEKIKKMSKEKQPFETQLPYLNSMKKIYYDIVSNRKINPEERNEFRDKLLETFIYMSRNNFNYVNAKAIEFLLSNIFDIDKYEEKKIKQFATEGLKELLTIDGENTKENEDFIEERFPLYLLLIKKDTKMILLLPEVYSGSVTKVKEYLERYMSHMVRHLDKIDAENLIGKCNEKCEKIVICIIETIYGNREKFPIIGRINEEKLFRNISKYYREYYPDLVEGVIEISSKIPLSDFYTDFNFVIQKIQKGSDEVCERICKKLNEAKDKNFESFGETNKIKNKIIFYILYFYSLNLESKNIFVDICKKFYKFYFHAVDIDDFKELNCVIFQWNYDQFYLDFVEDSYHKISEMCEHEKVKVYHEILIDKIDYNLNEMFKKKPFEDIVFEKIISFAKTQKFGFKEKILPKLADEIKTKLREKDLVLFGDL